MPLTGKGEEILHNMEQEYGSKKGESVFYASKNAGRISGVDVLNHPFGNTTSYDSSKPFEPENK